jgi:hypothetical protein
VPLPGRFALGYGVGSAQVPPEMAPPGRPPARRVPRPHRGAPDGRRRWLRSRPPRGRRSRGLGRLHRRALSRSQYEAGLVAAGFTGVSVAFTHQVGEGGTRPSSRPSSPPTPRRPPRPPRSAGPPCRWPPTPAAARPTRGRAGPVRCCQPHPGRPPSSRVREGDAIQRLEPHQLLLQRDLGPLVCRRQTCSPSTWSWVGWKPARMATFADAT